MTPINRSQALFVIREILSSGTDSQQITTLTVWNLSMEHVKASRRSFMVDPIRLAENAGISWSKALNSVERLEKIGALIRDGFNRFAVNPNVGPPELRQPKGRKKAD